MKADAEPLLRHWECWSASPDLDAFGGLCLWSPDSSGSIGRSRFAIYCNCL